MNDHAAPKSDEVARDVLEGHLRECYGRVVYSHKTQERCADQLQDRLGRIKLWQIILAAASTGSFLGVVLGSGQVGAIVGAIISAVLLALNTYTKQQDLGEAAQRHRAAGADLWLVREKYLALISDLKMNLEPISELLTRRDSLLEELHALYSSAPSTNGRAYVEAQKALKELEDMTFSDEEIDKCLPNNLRKSSD